MIKYRLIKEYPGSLKLGSETNGKILFMPENYYSGHPEFWQKVEEVDYEILSFSNINGSITHKNENGSFSWVKGGREYLENRLKNEIDLKIHSVKRLSDGEVFTVGDNICYSNNSCKVKISSFEIEGNIIWVKNKNGGACILSSATKIKTPLFTTEDGVEIFEGDTYWSVTDDFKLLVTHSARMLDYKIRAFSTKEKAEEYILLNKPCLSLNDLLSVWGDSANFGYFKDSPLFKSFETIAKSKL